MSAKRDGLLSAGIQVDNDADSAVGDVDRTDALCEAFPDAELQSSLTPRLTTRFKQTVDGFVTIEHI